ncbi:MAG: hypothetical protein M1484_01585 [Patescibacteria group bacterium]|nr:hypothetical protein [Patescibacteria group bacterium]MCL5431772.1 hypothetical protein [Patescibacteria group bacterium]
MKTEILGGGSFKNQTWIDQTQGQLAPEIVAEANYYNDWSAGNDAHIDFDVEIGKLLGKVGHEPFNLIAKSVGSLIGLSAVGRVPEQVRKIIICGIPLKDFPLEEITNCYRVLKTVPAENVLVVQNELDPHGSFEEAKGFLAKVNPAIKIMKKTGEFAATHNYPYAQDFKDFLGSSE